MDNTLKDLESNLETLTPRGLSDLGRENCHQLIDQLVVEYEISTKNLNRGYGGWKGSAAAAAVALGIGISGGWFLGGDRTSSLDVENKKSGEAANVLAFEHLDYETWILATESPNVYVTKSGEIREISREVEVTEEVVQHRESGLVVTIETTDHHVVDAPKSDF
ncbi:MAG: hypothetical protein L7U83_05590 [Akkermansiaceae bacterium]|nr:hypothetical protein [Akkermansiaceae bacterium]